MTVFAVVLLKVHNEEIYQKYIDGIVPILTKFECKMVALDDKPHVLEGEWPYTRSLILSFPSQEVVDKWYNDPEYQALAKYRWDSTHSQIAVLKEFALPAADGSHGP